MNPDFTMHRRRFLQASSVATLFTMTTAGRGSAAPDDKARPPWIDRARLESRNQNRSTVVCQQGMVCASQPLAAMAGIDILKRGGNCIDAAIATNAVLGVTEPASNGIGGDLFAILWSEQDQRLYGLNASGRAPADWNLEVARERQLDSIPRVSPLSWSVPGCVSGWTALQDRFGKLGLAPCLEAAIEYAQQGFPLSPLIADHFRLNEAYDSSWSRVYHPAGKQPKYGDIFRNPLLAKSLKAIATSGGRAFYEGQIAQQMVAKSQSLGGRLSLRDLADHQADWVEPVSTSYRGWDVWEIPPNGQGIAALQILNMLESFPVSELQPNSAEHLHLFLEAKKLAFEDRARYYADPKFAEVPVEWLISKDYARQRAKRINPTRAAREVPYGDPPLDSDTVYLAAADRDGNMVSFIQSLYNGFGSTICPDGVGFSIQNRGQAFSLDPDHANCLAPNKRPFHTIIPGFLTRDRRPVMAFGVMGGDFQPQGHAQVLMNMLDFGMSPQQAGEQPRVAHEGSSHPWGGAMQDGGEVVLERGFTDELRQQLVDRGHRVKEGIASHGGYQAIWREDHPRRYFGGSDPRKDGAAIGY
jgi:gamma-glutamyltranspeptidase/glutathione hydrolase